MINSPLLISNHLNFTLRSPEKRKSLGGDEASRASGGTLRTAN